MCIGNKGMEEKIMELIEKRPGTSFVEFKRHIKGIDGEYAFVVNGEHKGKRVRNIVLWEGLSKEFIEVLVDMIKNKKIYFKAVNPLIYTIDGVMLSFPIAKRLVEYKEPHWLPVVFIKNYRGGESNGVEKS